MDRNLDIDIHQERQYLIVAAIDFGTTYSGWAYSARMDFVKDPTRVFLKQWTDPTSTMIYNKTSTCILFDEKEKFSRFGFEAEAKYLDLAFENKHNSWYFFRRFKMCLFKIQVRMGLFPHIYSAAAGS